MFTKKKQAETPISVSLEEPLTTDSCTKLIMELIKYVLYQKQQIPFAYDTLAELQTRLKPTDRNASLTKTLVSTLRNISENITSQFHTHGCQVREVIVIVGATMLSPKFCIRLELPHEILSSQSHTEYQHSSRKPLLNLMRSIVDCQEFQEAMTVPLGVTNTFVLLQKSDLNSSSDFFLPKPQYSPPVQTRMCFSIKFTQDPSTFTSCSCKDSIKIYQDLATHEASQENVDNKDSHVTNDKQSLGNSSYLWYQSKEVIKGFKYVR